MKNNVIKGFLLFGLMALSFYLSACTITIKKDEVIFKVDDEVYYTTTAEEDVVFPQDPTKEGYKFEGWYQGEEKVTAIAAGTKGNIVLVAKWQSIIFTHSNGVINGLTEMGKKMNNFEIPTEIEGNTITRIGTGAFQDCSNIDSIIIPETVTSIGEEAFLNCSQLKKVVINGKITSIEKSTFEGCSILKNITIPEGVESIGESAFSGCSKIKSIVLPTTLTTIGPEAFFECEELQEINLPSGLTTIGSYAFSTCRKLASVTIPGSVTTIGSNIFRFCDLTVYCGADSAQSGWNNTWYDNSKVYWGINGDNYYQDETFRYLLEDDSATIIGASLGIVDLVFPEQIVVNEKTYNVTSIGRYQFYYGISSIIIPESIVNIPSHTFDYNVNGATVYCEAESKPSGYERNWEPYLGEVYWGFDINNYYNDGKVQYMIKNNEATVTGVSAAVEEIEIPEEITFNGNTYKVTSIANRAINDKRNLRKIIIPESINDISSTAFLVPNVKIYCIPSSDSSNLGNDWNDESDKYWSATENNRYNDGKVEYVLKNGEAYLANVATDVEKVVIPAEVTINGTVYKVTNIGDSAFAGCENLRSVEFSTSITTIGKYAFRDCVSLQEVSIPKNITNIKMYAFYGCVNLRTISLPEKLENIEIGLFSKCARLASVTIPKGVTKIGISAFVDCISLTSITIPEGVITLEAMAFENCLSLTNVILPSTLEKIEYYAFQGCWLIEAITIPQSVQIIEHGAFAYCSRLTINCEVESVPSGWEENWNSTDCPVNWK